MAAHAGPLPLPGPPQRGGPRRLCSLFLASKEFHGAAGFAVTDEIALAVAAQACLPVLRLGLPWYEGFVGIVMHEDQVLAPRQWTDDDGGMVMRCCWCGHSASHGHSDDCRLAAALRARGEEAGR